MGFCYSCMSQIDHQTAVCPYCKSQVPYIPLHKEDLQPGTRLYDGRFVIGRALGHGGYGITYIAYDTKMDVRRTIKEYFPKGAVRDSNLVPVYPESEAANVERTREHFLHEARMMIRASEGHIPGIVQGIDQFKENGTSYILMEYLEGYTLDDYMHQVLYGPFKWADAVKYATDALDALQKLHEKNILHRDISCNNIFLCTDNTVRLIDFGSAEPLDKAQTDPGSLWRSRKPAYTPREQAENRVQGTYSDVYAMGVVLFKMITGNVDRQLNGRMLPSVRAAANDQEIPAALDRILMEATAEDPEKRIQTAGEFRKRLLPLIGVKEKSSRKGLLIGLLAFLVAVLGLGIFAIVSSNNNQVAEDTWAAISMTLQEKSVTVPYGEKFTISGSSEAGETVQLFMQEDGSEQKTVAGTAQADKKGKWTISYDTAKADVPLNRTVGFECSIGYQNEEHINRSGTFRLLIDRELSPLSIGYSGQNSKNKEVETGEKVRVSGSGTIGQNVTVTITSGRTELTKDAVWEQNIWWYEIDTAELKSDDLRKEWSIGASYTGFTANEKNAKISKENELSLTVKRTLVPIQIYFEDQEKKLTVTNTDEGAYVYGTGEPNERIIVHIGEDRTQRTTVENDGTWKAPIPAVNTLAGYLPNAITEYPIYAIYVKYENDDTMKNIHSETITLVSDVRIEEADTSPVITNVTRTVDEGGIILLQGTAAKGAKMELRITKDRTNEHATNLVEGIKIQASQEDGSWEYRLNTEAIQDEREEGKVTQYYATVFYEKKDKEYVSNAMGFLVNKPIVYDVPTIQFEDSERTELTVRYTESVTVTGTARMGQHLHLLINDEPMQSDIVAKLDGSWSYQFTSLTQWMPELNQQTVLSLRIQYTEVEITSEIPIRLIITNPMFKTPEVFLNGQENQALIGRLDSVNMTVAGEAGRAIDLIRNDQNWKYGTLGEDGTYTISLSEKDVPTGTDQAVFYARYAQQPDNQSGKVMLQIDRTAEPINVGAAINEESTEIRGTAESKATLELFINETKIREIQANGDGSFVFDGLTLNPGDQIQIKETDLYGNTYTWNNVVKEVPRAAITLAEYANGSSLTYGSDSATLSLSGTGAPNKTLLITVKQNGQDVASKQEVTIGNDEKWAAKVSLPVADKSSSDLAIQYLDGRGQNILLYAFCDASVEEPEIQPEIIYEHNPDTLTCILKEANCTVSWRLISATGKGKARTTLPTTTGMQTEIELPTNRIAGDKLIITVKDAYGNTAKKTLTVMEQRDEISGMIASVIQGDKEIHSGDTISGTLSVQAYAAAGSDNTAGSPTLTLVQNGNTISRANLNSVSGDDLLRVANKLSGHQADLGWQVKKAEMTTAGIQEGACELRLSFGSKVVDSWPLMYSSASDDQNTVTHVDDSVEGYDIGIDVPSGTFNPKTIYLSGWLICYDSDTAKSVTSGLLTLYEDKDCNEKVSSVNAKKVTLAKRLPGTTKCGDAAKSLSGDAYEKAGWYMQMKPVSAPSGTYWATLDTGDVVFGPFALTLDTSEPQTKLKDFTNSLSWLTEE